jgi:hypothetical protein
VIIGFRVWGPSTPSHVPHKRKQKPISSHLESSRSRTRFSPGFTNISVTSLISPHQTRPYRPFLLAHMTRRYLICHLVRGFLTNWIIVASLLYRWLGVDGLAYRLSWDCTKLSSNYFVRLFIVLHSFFFIDRQRSYSDFLSFWSASTAYSKIKFECKLFQFMMFFMSSLIKRSSKSIKKSLLFHSQRKFDV